MEPRELYGPEDIEQLLLERAYDDLLEEERAFVLRHLSGRAEYSAMRSLLLRMQEDQHDTPPLDAEPQVRAAVMQAFRDQQRPPWRIWLNSVQAFLAPKETRSLWRPALAFGSLALLITAGVIGLRQLAKAPPQLAQAHEVPAPKAPVPSPAQEQKNAEVAPGTQQAATGRTTVATDKEEPIANAEGQTSTVTNELAATTTKDEGPAATNAQMDVAPATADDQVKYVPSLAPTASRDWKADSTVRLEDSEAFHQMDRNDMLRNNSQAATTVNGELSGLAVVTDREMREKASTGRKKKEMQDGGATDDVSAYVDLLRAAW